MSSDTATPRVPTASERRQQQLERRKTLQQALIAHCENGINQNMTIYSDAYYAVAHTDITRDIPGLKIYSVEEVKQMLREVYIPQHYNVSYGECKHVIDWSEDH